MAGATWNCCCLCAFCVHHITMHNVTSCKATYVICMFSCNLPPVLSAKWPGSFTYYCGNTGRNGDWNKSQHRKLIPEKKILLPLLQGFEHKTFQSQVRCSNHWTILAPQVDICTTASVHTACRLTYTPQQLYTQHANTPQHLYTQHTDIHTTASVHTQRSNDMHSTATADTHDTTMRSTAQQL